jgi:hypothetical protein
MEDLIQDLLEIDGVKNVKRHGGPVLRINLFSREIPGSEAEEIRVDLRKVTPKIKSCLDDARQNGDISGWEWIVRPEKQYQETSLGRSKVSDRKAKGYDPSYYRVSIDK